MDLIKLKHSFEIECFTNCFFKTFQWGGIFRIKNAYVALLEVNLSDLPKKILRDFNSKSPAGKKGELFLHTSSTCNTLN